MTAKARIKLDLEKEHYNDASAMIGANIYKCSPFLIKPKRTKVWENNPTKTCSEKNGFKHYDVVKVKHKIKGVIVGSIRSLKAKNIAIRTSFSDNFLVSYNKTKLLWRTRNLVYCRI